MRAVSDWLRVVGLVRFDRDGDLDQLLQLLFTYLYPPPPSSHDFL